MEAVGGGHCQGEAKEVRKMSLVFGRGVRDRSWMVEEDTEAVVFVEDSNAKVRVEGDEAGRCYDSAQ